MKKLMLALFCLLPLWATAQDVICLGHSNNDILCNDWKKYYNTDPDRTIYDVAKWGWDLYSIRNIENRFTITSGGVTYTDYLDWVEFKLDAAGVDVSTFSGDVFYKPTLSYTNDPTYYADPVPIETRYADLVANQVQLMERLDQRFPSVSKFYFGVRLQWANPASGEMCSRSPMDLSVMHLQAIQDAIAAHGNPKYEVGPYFPSVVLDENDFQPSSKLDNRCHPKAVGTGAGVGSGVGTDKVVPLLDDFFNGNQPPPPQELTGTFLCLYFPGQPPHDCDGPL